MNSLINSAIFTCGIFVDIDCIFLAFFYSLRSTSNTEMASVTGLGPANQIILVPGQFGNELFNGNIEDPILYEKIFNSGAFSQFAQDTNYDNRNAPLIVFSEYFSNKYPYLSIVSSKQSVIAGERAIKLEGNDVSGNVQLVIYLTLHGKEAYNFDYVANINDYDKYLPDFEEMIKSFRFRD